MASPHTQPHIYQMEMKSTTSGDVGSRMYAFRRFRISTPRRWQYLHPWLLSGPLGKCCCGTLTLHTISLSSCCVLFATLQSYIWAPEGPRILGYHFTPQSVSICIRRRIVPLLLGEVFGRFLRWLCCGGGCCCGCCCNPICGGYPRALRAQGNHTRASKLIVESFQNE
jgi:hypothetical protein